MPRAAAGPRTIDATGTFYAVKTIKGRRRYISLNTKNIQEARRRWPKAQAELEAIANPVPGDPHSPHFVYDTETGEGKWEASPWDPPEEKVGPKQEGITWEEAAEVAAKRRQRRSGRPVSSSWYDAMRQALRFTNKMPEQLTVKDVRLMINRMEAQGLADTTISVRCATLSGILEALIRTGTCPDLINPFKRVDYQAVSIIHHAEATPEDLRSLYNRLGEVPEGVRTRILLMMLTGVRIGEACYGRLEGATNPSDVNGSQGFPQEKVGATPCPLSGDSNPSDANGSQGFPQALGGEEISWLIIEDSGDWSPKNRSSYRRVPLPPNLLEGRKQEESKVVGFKQEELLQGFKQEELLQGLKQEDTPLRGFKQGDTTTPGTVRRWFNKITPKHITPHSLRHAWRTMARQAGMDEMVAERLMGHTAGTRVSQIYGSYPDELLVSEARKVWLHLESQGIKAEGP